MPNARGEPRPEAGARHERTLEGVGSSAWFGAGRDRGRWTPPTPKPSLRRRLVPIVR